MDNTKVASTNRNRAAVILVSLLLAAPVAFAAATAPSSAASASHVSVSAPAPANLSPAAAAAWEALMGADGEYAAIAAYSAVLDEYGAGVQPYASILQAEQQHARALVRQLERLGVSVPVNPYLGKVAAPTSLQAAAEAWAEGEVANGALYDTLMAQASGDAGVQRVFTNLRRASQESHLPAFRAAAESGGTLDAAAMQRLGLGGHKGQQGGKGRSAN